jgi:hypothetical protein
MTENILNVLPFLKGWQFSSSKQKNVKVEKKQSLVDVKEKGYLTWAICSTNDADAELAFEADGKPLTESILTAKDLATLGLTSPNPFGFFCSRFDVIFDVFVVAFMPAEPWPYAESLKVTLRATEKKPILVVHNFEHKSIKITDEALFRQGLKDLGSK